MTPQVSLAGRRSAGAAEKAGFRSCLVLPLRTDRRPAGAVALYGQERHVFQGAAHDIALTFAAQGGSLLASGDAPASFGKNDSARPVRTGTVTPAPPPRV